MHYRPRSLCSWRLYVLFCFSNFSFCGPVLGYSLLERRLCFHASKSLRLILPKQNYLIIRTSIEDGSINNQSAYLTKNSKTKYPCLLHLDHPPHGVFRFVAALPSPPFHFPFHGPMLGFFPRETAQKEKSC